MGADQKLGLSAGLAAVLVVAVVYFNKPLPATAGGPAPAAPIAERPPTTPPASVGLPDRPARVKAGRDDD
jgi:hypothetical protein